MGNEDRRNGTGVETAVEVYRRLGLEGTWWAGAATECRRPVWGNGSV